jgi:hypothetical protein
VDPQRHGGRPRGAAAAAREEAFAPLCLPANQPGQQAQRTAHHDCNPSGPLRSQATLAAANVAGVLQGFGAWANPNDITPFLDGPIASLPRAAPSIVNAKDVGLPTAA